MRNLPPILPSVAIVIWSAMNGSSLGFWKNKIIKVLPIIVLIPIWMGLTFSSSHAWFEKGTVSEVEDCVEKNLSKSKSILELKWYCVGKVSKKCNGNNQLYGETTNWYLCDELSLHSGQIQFDWYHKKKGVIVTSIRGEMTLKVEGKSIGPFQCGNNYSRNYTMYGKDSTGYCSPPKRMKKQLCDPMPTDKSDGKRKKIKDIQWSIEAHKCLIDDEE